MENKNLEIKKNEISSQLEKFIKSKYGDKASNSLMANCMATGFTLQQIHAALPAILEATSLGLSLNKSSGLCYIIPYNNKKTNTTDYQFQMGYKGYIQLFLRSGLVSKLGVDALCEGDGISYDNFGEIIIKKELANTINKIIGYFAYVKLNNGFSKVVYMSIADIENHRNKYSKSYRATKNWGIASDDFESMAKKTVLLRLKNWIPMSNEFQQAYNIDERIVKDETLIYEEAEVVKTEQVKDFEEMINEN